MANLHLIAKGGLAILVIVSIAVLIERLTNGRSEIPDSGIGAVESNTISPIIDIVEPIFNENFAKCLAEHSKSDFFSFYLFKNTSYTCLLPPGQCLHNLLITFSKLMESFDIKLQLIEPSILFCLLPSPKKYNLVTRGFSNSNVQRSRNVITFGVLQTEADILDKAVTRKKLISAGYKILRYSKWMKSGLINSEKSESDIETVHYFILRHNLVMHLIAFYPRRTYLWSPGLNSTEISVKGLLYVNNTAFENFTISPAHLDTLSTAQIFLPSDARCFLLDMMSSNFLECKADLNNLVSDVNTKAQMALKEIKVVLASQMVIFWLWSRTLQGWLEKCDVLHYSEELNLSIAAKSVEGYNFSALFTNSECQHIENLSNLDTIVKIELKCHGLSINVFLMYENKNTYWYEHYDGHNTYKLSFPRFTLCSTDVLGMKINIPCETSEIFKSEYGQFLKNITLRLDPGSMKNVFLLNNT